MDRHDRARIDRWARRHHGLVTFDASGLSRPAWYRALGRGELLGVHPHVARLPGAPVTTHQRIAAAVLAGDGRCIASHRSAAFLHSILRPARDPIEVSVVGRRPCLDLEGVVVHRPRDSRDLRPVSMKGVATTPLLRSVLDLAAVDPAGVVDAVGHLVATRRTSLAALDATVARHSERGRTGVVALRAAVAAYAIDGKPADSLLEPAMHRLVRQHRLPPVEFHPVVEGWEVDFRVVDTPVLLECDGWATHGADRRQFERDRRRDAELVAAGWIVLRFTYRAITQQSSTTAARIRAAVARWQPNVDRLA